MQHILPSFLIKYKNNNKQQQMKTPKKQQHTTVQDFKKTKKI